MKRLFAIVAVMMLCVLPMRAAYAEDVVRLIWEPIVGAVLYEVALIADEKGNVVLWQDVCSANGMEVDADVMGAKYYRVRPIDYEHRPISQEMIIGSLKEAERADGVPYILFSERHELLTYPVYTWIPVYGASGYEIEVARHEMQSCYLSTRDAQKIYVAGGSAFDYYDDERIGRGVDTWYRVRTLYDDGRRSAWSQSVQMTRAGAAYYGAIGDSITHGGGSITHTPNEPAYAWMSYTNRKIMNLGRSGDTTKRIAERVERDTKGLDLKVLFIMGGINDLRAGEPAETVIAGLNRAVVVAKKAGIRPILLTVPPCNPRLMTERMGYPLTPSWQAECQKVNDWIRHQVDYIDVSQAVTDDNGYLMTSVTTDGLHPDANGKRKIGEAVRAYLDERNMP